MRDYPVHTLADLLIHELLHATVFLKGEVQFNEELAEAVGSAGAALYMERTYGRDSDEYRGMIAGEEDSAAFVLFIQDLSAELEALYGGGGDREKMLERKAEIIASAQERFDGEYDERFRSDNYRGFARMGINNAFLDLYRLYHAEGNFFRDLYRRGGADLQGLRHLIAAAKTLDIPRRRGGMDPRRQLEAALEGEGH
jgi:predicted aminopeptidase